MRGCFQRLHMWLTHVDTFRKQNPTVESQATLFPSSEVVKALKIFFVGNWEQNIRNIFVEIPNSSPISFVYNPFPRILFRLGDTKASAPRLAFPWTSSVKAVSNCSRTGWQKLYYYGPQRARRGFLGRAAAKFKSHLFPIIRLYLGKVDA